MLFACLLLHPQSQTQTHITHIDSLRPINTLPSLGPHFFSCCGAEIAGSLILQFKRSAHFGHQDSVVTQIYFYSEFGH